MNDFAEMLASLAGMLAAGDATPTDAGDSGEMFGFEFSAHRYANRGQQWTFEFDNGYGASVIIGPYSYGGAEGLYELAVRGPDGDLDYTTPITDDVEGHLTPNDVTRLLAQIAALPDKRV